MFELREIDLTNTWNIRNIRNCSPGPVSALGEKREEVWGGKSGVAVSPAQTTALFDPVNGFLPFSPTAEPGPRLEELEKESLSY